MPIFAKNEAANQWLAEHPWVLGGGALALGILLLAVGVLAVATGKAPAKRGPDLEGANAKVYGVILLVAGTGCSLFGLVKLAGAVL
jgi:hypothetical protein